MQNVLKKTFLLNLIIGKNNLFRTELVPKIRLDACKIVYAYVSVRRARVCVCVCECEAREREKSEESYCQEFQPLIFTKKPLAPSVVSESNYFTDEGCM
jgi:hypothetical protein